LDSEKTMRLVWSGVRPAPAIAVVAMAALSVLLAACAVVPQVPYAGRDPSDAAAPVPAVGYRSTIGTYQSQRPVEPASWREQNERIAPAPNR
jgi:hypothetical protein